MQNLRLLRAALARRWPLILIVFVVITAAATAGVYLRKPVFESQAAVLVNVERFGVSVSRADMRQDVAVLQAVEAVTSQAEVLRSNDLIERTLDSLDPDIFKGAPPRNPVIAFIVAQIDSVKRAVTELLRELRLLPPFNERYALVKEIESNLKISTVRQAQVIRLEFSASNPVTAQLVLQRMLEIYVRRAAEHTLGAEGAGPLTLQADSVRGDLEAVEQELFDLRARYSIVDFAAEKASLSERIGRLTSLLEDSTVDSRPQAPTRNPGASQAASNIVEASARDIASNSAGAQLAQLRSQISGLRVSRVALLADLSSEHPRVRSLDQQIASLEALLQQEVNALKSTVAGYRARLSALLAVEPQLLRLERKVTSLSESYDVYRKTSEDRRLMREQEARLQIQIIDPPSLAYVPRGPVPIALVAAGALLGLVSGLGLALLLSYLRDEAEPLTMIEAARLPDAPEPMRIAAPAKPVDPSDPGGPPGPGMAGAG